MRRTPTVSLLKLVTLKRNVRGAPGIFIFAAAEVGFLSLAQAVTSE